MLGLTNAYICCTLCLGVFNLDSLVISTPESAISMEAAGLLSPVSVDCKIDIVSEMGGGIPESDEEEQEIVGGRQEEKRKS